MNEFYQYSEKELICSSCQPNRILLYFDFGTNQNLRLHKLLNSSGKYKFLDSKFCPLSTDGTINEISKEEYLKLTGEFLQELTTTLHQEKTNLFIPANIKLTHFLISNNISFDIIYPNRNVSDWILNEYLESDYSPVYIKYVLGVPVDKLSAKTNYTNLTHLYYNLPQYLCNRIMITTPSDIDVEYSRYFNFHK